MISAIILLKCAADLKFYLGLDGLFFLFSCVSVGSIIFAYFCIPETFGKSLEEIEEHYRNISYGTRIDTRHKRQLTSVSNKSFDPE